MQHRWPARPYRMLLAGMGLLITIALQLLTSFPSPLPKILEGTLYFFCFVLMSCSQQLRSLFVAIPKRQQWLLMGLAGILVIAQLHERPRQTFPFLPWNMYHGRFPDPPQYLEYVGVCQDGREVVIPVGQVFTSQHRTVLWRLQSLRNQMEAEIDQAKRQDHADQFHRLLQAIVARFREQHPDADVTRIRVIRCTMPRPAPGLELDVTRHTLGEYPVS